MRQLSRAVCLTLTLPLTLLAARAQTPSLTELLGRSASYVRQFDRNFAVVIADEDYSQQLSLRKTTQRRNLRSELLFMWLGEERRWISVRNVLSVDGNAVPDGANRLERLLAAPPDGGSRLRSLRDEGARFNLGTIHRNFDDPTLALQFLDAAFQPRFRFADKGVERVNGIDLHKINFDETQEPSVVQDDGVSVPSTGAVWVNAFTGAIVRTRLVLRRAVSEGTSAVGRSLGSDDELLEAVIEVDYARDPKLDLWVPARMQEHYDWTAHVTVCGPGITGRCDRKTEQPERIRCTALYSHYRRFETTGHIIQERQ